MQAHTTFGDFIRQERDRANFGLREAARLLGISGSYLSRLEAGEFRPPSGTLLLRMAQVYRSDIKKLLDLAKDRQGEVMAADVGVAPAVQAFYRLAHDQPPEMQEAMLRGALDALQLPDKQKQQILEQLRAMLSRAEGRDLPRRAKNNDGLFAFDIEPRCLSRDALRDLAGVVLRKVFGTEIPLPVPVETIVRRVDRDIVLVIHDEIDGGRLRDGSPAVLGLSRWSGDGQRRELVIHDELFESEEPSRRRRANFTIAHELFHCIEHLPLARERNRDICFARKLGYATFSPELSKKPWYERNRGPRKLLTREDWREWQANTFAAELLMPVESVLDAFADAFNIEKIECERGALCGAAEQAARARKAGAFGNEASLADQFDVNPQAMAIRLMSLGLIVEQP